MRRSLWCPFDRPRVYMPPIEGRTRQPMPVSHAALPTAFLWWCDEPPFPRLSPGLAAELWEVAHRAPAPVDQVAHLPIRFKVPIGADEGPACDREGWPLGTAPHEQVFWTALGAAAWESALAQVFASARTGQPPAKTARPTLGVGAGP